MIRKSLLIEKENNMRILYTVLASMMFVTSAFAQDFFFTTPNLKGNWQVVGDNGTSTLNPACKLITKWQDGSTLELIKDLADGELYILFINNAWNISDDPNTKATARFNFHNNNYVTGGAATYELLNKNTIRFRGITADKFIPDFVNSQKMVIIMPGTIPNAVINLVGTSNGIDMLSNCVKAYTPASRNTKSGMNL